MTHSGGTWKNQLEGEGLAVCRVRRGCSKEELEVKREDGLFNTPGARGGHETAKAALHGRETPRRVRPNLWHCFAGAPASPACLPVDQNCWHMKKPPKKWGQH